MFNENKKRLSNEFNQSAASKIVMLAKRRRLSIINNTIDTDKNNTFKLGDEVRYKLAKDKIQNISKSGFHNKELTELVVDNGKRRATDASYSLAKHKIIDVKEIPNQPTLYYIDGIKHGFTSGNLQSV